MRSINRLPCLLCLITTSRTYAFQTSISTQPSFTTTSSITTPHSNGNPLVLNLSRYLDAIETDDDDDDFLYLSDKQIKTLRKEADLRKGLKTLATYSLNADEDYASNIDHDEDYVFSDTVLTNVAQMLEEEELVEVRAISKNNVKTVGSDAYLLAANLEGEMDRYVVVVRVKGFTASLYSPREEGAEDKGTAKHDKIKLRTNYKHKKFNVKPKAVRNEKGQIVMDDEGKVVRE
mmetsp:Transcript_36438/g.43876  ORF Transcript_36438/g.43876 Transcript_36438/m.43876 type:complete len:233 (-) Transcript_36438:134-832(-)